MVLCSCMHKELMCEIGGNYNPEEQMLDKAVMRSNITTPARSPGILLDIIPEHNTRRAKHGHSKNVYLADRDNSVVSVMSTESHYLSLAKTSLQASRQHFQASTMPYYQPQAMQP
eukprot:4692845-Ditylum_brightwellii.AAC.1